MSNRSSGIIILGILAVTGLGLSGFMFVKNEIIDPSGNPALKAKAYKGSSFQVFSDNIYDILIKNYKGEDIILATDPMRIKGIYDLEDCTKVLGENANIFEIGKQINNYNRLDMGVFVMSTKTISSISQKIERDNEKFGVSNIVLACIALNLKVKYFDFSNTIWVDVDNEVEYKKLKENFNESNKLKPFNLDF